MTPGPLPPLHPESDVDPHAQSAALTLLLDVMEEPAPGAGLRVDPVFRPTNSLNVTVTAPSGIAADALARMIEDRITHVTREMYWASLFRLTPTRPSSPWSTPWRSRS